QVRLGKQQGSKSNAHLPTTGIAVEGPRLHLLVEAQTQQDPSRSRWSTIRVDRQEPLVNLAEPMRIRAGFAFSDQTRSFSIGRPPRRTVIPLMVSMAPALAFNRRRPKVRRLVASFDPKLPRRFDPLQVLAQRQSLGIDK